MASPIDWQVQIDTRRDGTFGASIDDITEYVVSMDWANGFTNAKEPTAYDGVAPPARLTLVLDNSGKEFNPETLGSELIVNGDFASWTSDNPNSWTVTGESGTNPEVSQVSSTQLHNGTGTGSCNLYSATSSTVSIAQTVLTVGTTYRVTLRVTAYREVTGLPGGLYIYNGSDIVGYLIKATGTYTFYFNATSTQFRLETYRGVDITIDDVSVRASSLYGRLLVPGLFVRVRGTYSSVTYNFFHGVIAHNDGIVLTTNPQAGNVQQVAVKLKVEDAMHKLLDAEYIPPLLTNATADDAIQAMFDGGIIRWPYPAEGTLLDTPGTDVLGVTAALFSHDLLTLETGQTTFEYLGDLADKTGRGVSAQTYIRDLLAAEAGGRFWWEARENRFIFHNRHHDANLTTVDASFTGANFTDVSVSFADDVVNEIMLNFTSRKVGTPGSVVWDYKEVPFQLKRGDTRTFNARYVDPNNDKARVGVRDGIVPQANIDYIANYAEAGNQENLSTQVLMSVEFGATAAKVSLQAVGNNNLWIQKLQLRGTPFIWNDEQIVVSDSASIAAYHYSPAPPKNIRLLTDADFADQLARYWLAKFSQPIYRVTSVSFKVPNSNATQANMAVLRAIGDRISITESWSNHSGDYIIVGEKHKVGNAGYDHDVTWFLKPVTRETFYILGVTGRNELDSTNKLGL